MAAARGYAFFDTALGRCGIAWGNEGVLATALPHPDSGAMRRHLRRRAPDLQESEPPPSVAAAMAAIRALLAGERVDLGFVALDLRGEPGFNVRAWTLARDVPAGRTVTYGELAARLGDPLLARAVGQAMGANPFPIVVPCHRVLAAGARAGGFSAPGGVDTKRRLLEIERARIGAEPSLFD